MNDPWWWIAGLMTPVVLAVLGFYAHVEYQARLLKTSAVRIPGGLRFVANGWRVEVHRASQQVRVQTRQGHYSHQLLDGGVAQVLEGPLTVSLPAPGLQIEIIRTLREQAGEPPQPTGVCSVVFRASDESAFAAAEKPGGEQHTLRLDGVPEQVAAQFQQFTGQIRVWVDKVDYQIAQQLQLRKQRAEAEVVAQERAAARAEAQKKQVPLSDIPPAEQIVQWRQAAGFSGNSEVGYTPEGKIAWFIDLDGRGRITLHAERRTIHTTLLGATVINLGAELEVGVRDDYWTDAEPELKRFKVLKGAHPDVRRAWKERMDILCDKLRSGEISVG